MQRSIYRQSIYGDIFKSHFFHGVDKNCSLEMRFYAVSTFSVNNFAIDQWFNFENPPDLIILSNFGS